MLRTTRSCELQGLRATRASALQLRFARQSAWENLTRQDLTPPPQPSIHLKRSHPAAERPSQLEHELCREFSAQDKAHPSSDKLGNSGLQPRSGGRRLAG